MPVTITLPSARKPIIDDISKHTLIFPGEKGAGKTSFATQFQDHFMLEFEIGNATHLECNYEEVHDYEQLEAYITALEKPENKNYCKTLIIDELQLMYALYVERVMKEQKMTLDEKFTFDEWRIVGSYFDNLISRLQRLSCGVIYTCHVEAKENETRTGRKYTRLEPRISGQCNKKMEAFTKLCGVIMMDSDSSRYMQLEGSDMIMAYNKFPNHFINPVTGKKHLRIPLGNSPETAFKNFMQAYNNQLAVNPPTNSPANQGKGQPAVQLQQTPAKKPALRF